MFEMDKINMRTKLNIPKQISYLCWNSLWTEADHHKDFIMFWGKGGWGGGHI